MTPDTQALADAKSRIKNAERGLLRLGEGRDSGDNLLRARFTRQLWEALDEYYAILTGQPRVKARDFSN
jgi:hypothetical protein